MFLLRRTAARAISASPSAAYLVRPRSINTLTPSALRPRHQQSSIALFQRRFASDETPKTEPVESVEPVEPVESVESAESAETAAAAASENFAQTAAEAPVDENLTPAQEEVQAAPTDKSATVGPDALEEAARATETSPQAQRQWGPRSAQPNKMLYVGNLYYEVTPDQLKRVFSRFGDVESIKIVYDNRGLSRGFAYVEYKNLNDAQAAIDNLDMQVFEGRNLVVQFHTPKYPARTRGPNGSTQPSPPSKTLFIGNMSFEMSDKDLNDLFRDIRNVLDVRVAIDRRTGQPRGFAHADFIDVASATRAREILKEKTIYGRQLRVDFSQSGTTAQRAKRQDSAQE